MEKLNQTMKPWLSEQKYDEILKKAENGIRTKTTPTLISPQSVKKLISSFIYETFLVFSFSRFCGCKRHAKVGRVQDRIASDSVRDKGRDV
jgi:hypothetical protein